MKNFIKETIPQLCIILGLIGGLYIGCLIASNIDNAAVAIICIIFCTFAGCFLLCFIVGSITEKAFDISDNDDKSSNYNSNKPIQSFFTKANNQECQNNINLNFKEFIEKEFEKSINEVFDITSNSNDPLAVGLSVYSAIAHTCDYLKKEDYKATFLSKQEQVTIIDEVTKKMLHKYLENY